ncbi:MAG: S-layer homology domain-containing protein [Clostridia bacterium]|nr:S-layer homology domain-containing protein [Clostridia bacterium]
MTVYSEEKKVITYNPDPFNVVVQIPLWPKNGKIYYNDYESTEYDSQKGGVNGFVDFWYWTASVEQGMGKYIDRFWLKFRGGKGISYMELNRIGADMFGAMDKADRNLWMSWLDYTYTLKDSYYTEYLNQPVAVYDYTEIAAEKQAVQDDLNDYENQKVNIDGNEVKLSDIDFEYLETLTENDYDRAAVLEFKALMAQASFEASGIVGVDDVRELSDEQLIEKMGITKVEITSDDLQDYANNPDFTKIEKDGSITHYVYADAENVISVDVNELTMTTHDYTALSSDNTQTFNVRKSSRSGSQQSTAEMESGLKMVEEKVKEAQNTLTSVQFAIENVTEAADKYAKDQKLSETLKAALSSKAKTVAQLGSKVLNHALTAYSFWEWGNITAEMSEIKNTTNSLLNEYARIKLSGKDEDFADKEACLKAIDSLIEANKELFDALMNKMLSLSAQLLAAFVSILVAIPSFGISLLVNLLAMLIGFELDSTFDENIEIARQLLKRSQRDKARDCRPDRDEDEDDADCNPIYDPSGYVYEGVFSNRVEGATVTTYKYGQTGKWNAEDFSQENPLITNSDGYYRWDVPVGYYKVVAEKNGYKTADTTEIYSKDKLGKDRNDISDGTHVDFDGKTVPAGWHKVLPIQTEVHIPLESTQAPEVESATAYSDSIIVQFSQYMKEETVADNISITMGGETFTGEALKIEWPDSEESNHYYNRTFASQLKISRADDETWTGEVTVSIKDGENYADKDMDNTYSATLDVIPVINNIAYDSTVEINYDAEPQEVTIKLVDASGNGIAGIPVELNTGSMVVFEGASGDETVETTALSGVSDANGQVTFTVKANYPGNDTIVVTIPGRDETWEIPVTVGTEYSQTVVSEPVVTINGTEYRGQGHSVTVPSGTVITVTGENAEKLYYAIGENACPCQDDQIEITGNQLTLTESGYYKFAAFADGVYSSRVHINITVTNEGGAGSGTGTGGTAPVAPVTPPSAENNFADVAENAYYYDAVMWALENGITTGVSEDKFAPDMECSRAQAVTFLWRASGEPKPKDSSMPFSDVAENAYYRDAVLWAVENGITNGTGEDSFSPDMKCTREQIVTFLWRTAKHLGMDVSVGEDTNILSYDDAFDIGEWAIPAVQWACGAGVMNGTSEGTLSPQMVCSRAQIVTFLYRTFK